jgi:hypothetical protein
VQAILTVLLLALAVLWDWHFAGLLVVLVLVELPEELLEV